MCLKASLRITGIGNAAVNSQIHRALYTTMSVNFQMLNCGVRKSVQFYSFCCGFQMIFRKLWHIVKYCRRMCSYHKVGTQYVEPNILGYSSGNVWERLLGEELSDSARERDLGELKRQTGPHHRENIQEEKLSTMCAGQALRLQYSGHSSPCLSLASCALGKAPGVSQPSPLHW